MIIGYHIAPAKLNSIILKDGIGQTGYETVFQYGKKVKKKKLTYIWLREDVADWFKNLHEDPSMGDTPVKMTKWIIDVTGLNLKRDSETEDMSEWSTKFKSGEFGEGYTYDGIIPPERIIRMRESKTILQERANFNQFKQFWAKELFDKVITIDPSPDKRYEVWLLDRLRKQLTYSFKNFISTYFEPNSLPKEFINFYLQEMLLNKEFYDKNRQNQRERFAIYLNKFEYIIGSVENIPRLPPNIHKFLNMIPNISKVDISVSRILDGEDAPALTKALKIHRILSESGKITPEQKNIANFKTIQQLIEFITPFLEDYDFDEATIQGNQEVRPGEDFNVLLNDGKTLILEIITYAASEYWACVGTSWCIRQDERYFDHYTDDGKAPCIFYIKVGENGKRYKMAFLEGPAVQYQSPSNQALSIKNIKDSIPAEHLKVLEDYLWIAQFMNGKISYKMDFDAKFQNDSPNRVSDVVDIHDLFDKEFSSLTTEEAELRDFIEEQIDDNFFEYSERVPDDEIGEYINEEPEGGVDTEECEPCNGTGYALIASKDNGTWLHKNQFNDVFTTIKEKNPDLAKEFEQAYKFIAERNMYKLINKPAMLKIAKEFKNKCRYCGGDGKITGEKNWSEDQRERAQQEYDDKRMDYYRDEYLRDLNFSSWNSRASTLQKYIQDAFHEEGTISTVEFDTPAEEVGIALVNEHGYKTPPGIQTQTEKKVKNNIILEKLLSRFKI